MKLRRPSRATWLVAFAAVAGTLLARAITWFALGDVPHVMDEIAYLLQARTLGSLHVSAPVHLPRAAFSMWFVDDRWATYSIFPPGWPAVLGLGERLGARAWVNPILHGITAAVIARAARRIGGVRAEVVTAFAYAFSPQALILAGSFMSHTLVALCAATVLRAGVAMVTGRPRASLFVAAGVALGMATLSRPLCAVVMGVGAAAFVVSTLLRHPARRRATLRVCAIALAPFLAGVLLLGAYNHALTGKASRFPQSSWFDEHAPPVDIVFFQYRPGCNELGFGPSHGCDFGIDEATHDLRNALSNTGDNISSWGLLAGGGPLAFIGAAYALRGGRRVGRRRRLRIGWSVATMIPAAVVLYALYWYAGTCYGGRFYQSALPALILLGALGMTLLARRRLAAGLALATWIAISGLALFMSIDEVADEYWGTDNRFDVLASSWRHEPALAMVAFQDDGIPMRRLTWTGFAGRKGKPPRWLNSVRALSALGVNDPGLEQPLVYSKYHPALVADLKTRFPSRALYIYLANADRKRDRLVKFEGSVFEEIDQVGVLPKDNFDAYTVPAYGQLQR